MEKDLKKMATMPKDILQKLRKRNLSAAEYLEGEIDARLATLDNFYGVVRIRFLFEEFPSPEVIDFLERRYTSSESNPEDPDDHWTSIVFEANEDGFIVILTS